MHFIISNHIQKPPYHKPNFLYFILFLNVRNIHLVKRQTIDVFGSQHFFDRPEYPYTRQAPIVFYIIWPPNIICIIRIHSSSWISSKTYTTSTKIFITSLKIGIKWIRYIIGIITHGSSKPGIKTGRRWRWWNNSILKMIILCNILCMSCSPRGEKKEAIPPIL